MKKNGRLFPLIVALAFIALGALPVQAASVGLFDWAFYVSDGGGTSTYEDFWGDSMPTTGSLNAEGLGILTWSTSAVGDNTFIAFFDHEIDETLNTNFNEFGTAFGTSAADQSWEIDEPGYVFGDIYENTTGWNGTDYSSVIGLDSFNNVDSNLPDDVSMAMGWDFSLGVDEIATITLTLSDDIGDMPGGFYLSQTDPDSDASIYFSSTLEFRPTGQGGPVIPEPSTLFLMGIGLAGLLGVHRRRSNRKKV